MVPLGEAREGGAVVPVLDILRRRDGLVELPPPDRPSIERGRGLCYPPPARRSDRNAVRLEGDGIMTRAVHVVLASTAVALALVRPSFGQGEVPAKRFLTKEGKRPT